jgi:hypothetical protein
MSANGLDSWTNWDDLPEAVREYLDHAPYQWSLAGVLFKLKRWPEAQVIADLQATDLNRKTAAYVERGFEVHPETGEPLGSAS